jgi:excinuclease UvrABC ATPase subunit
MLLPKSDWIIDIGPGAGEEGGKIVAEGPPVEVAKMTGKPHCALFIKSDWVVAFKFAQSFFYFR